jgi:hypothetical protein
LEGNFHESTPARALAVGGQLSLPPRAVSFNKSPKKTAAPICTSSFFQFCGGTTMMIIADALLENHHSSQKAPSLLSDLSRTDRSSQPIFNLVALLHVSGWPCRYTFINSRKTPHFKLFLLLPKGGRRALPANSSRSSRQDDEDITMATLVSSSSSKSSTNHLNSSINNDEKATATIDINSNNNNNQTTIAKLPWPPFDVWQKEERRGRRDDAGHDSYRSVDLLQVATQPSSHLDPQQQQQQQQQQQEDLAGGGASPFDLQLENGQDYFPSKNLFQCGTLDATITSE